jgi:hypothetical protein
MSKDPEGKKVPLIKKEDDSAEVPRTNTGVKLDNPEEIEAEEE